MVTKKPISNLEDHVCKWTELKFKCVYGECTKWILWDDTKKWTSGQAKKKGINLHLASIACYSPKSPEFSKKEKRTCHTVLL